MNGESKPMTNKSQNPYNNVLSKMPENNEYTRDCLSPFLALPDIETIQRALSIAADIHDNLEELEGFINDEVENLSVTEFVDKAVNTRPILKKIIGALKDE